MNSSYHFGLLARRERWGLSFRGWITLLVLLFSAVALLFFTVYPFLATTAPIVSDILIVEGWIGPNAVKAAANEIQSRHCTRVFTTGGPVDGYELDNSIYETYAHQAFSRLLRCGISSNLITRVPAAHVDSNRTYTSALALNSWFWEHNLHPPSVNLLTRSAHARRSRLLFQKALGPGTRVGIISVPPYDFSPARWWAYSAGVKEILSEGAAYLYARLFFWPSPGPASAPVR